MPGFERFSARFAAMVVIWVVALITTLLSFAIPYAILRIRDVRSERPDPQMGLKAAMYFFFSIGIMLFLNGLTVLVWDLLVIQPKRPLLFPQMKGLDPIQRIAIAGMVSGLIFALLYLGLVKGMTNDRNPAARRMFAGWRMAFHGLVVIVVVTVLLAIYFQEDFGGERTLDTRKGLWGVLLVWGPSWILHVVLVWFYSQPLYEPRRSDDRSEWQR